MWKLLTFKICQLIQKLKTCWRPNITRVWKTWPCPLSWGRAGGAVGKLGASCLRWVCCSTFCREEEALRCVRPPEAVERDPACSVLERGGAEKDTAQRAKAACVYGSPSARSWLGRSGALGVTQSSALHHPVPSWHVSPSLVQSCYRLCALCSSRPAHPKEILPSAKLCGRRPSCQYLFGVYTAVLTSSLVTERGRLTECLSLGGKTCSLPPRSGPGLWPHGFLRYLETFGFSPQYHTFLIICATS